MIVPASLLLSLSLASAGGFGLSGASASSPAGPGMRSRSGPSGSTGDSGPGSTAATSAPGAEPALSRDQIRQVVAKNRMQVEYCYEAALAQAPKLEGTVTVTWEITRAGKVAHAAVDAARSTLKSAAVDACLVQRISQWQFPTPHGRAVQVAYPWRFAAAAAPTKDQGRYDAIVAAPDRLPSDLALDPGRKPAAFLGFLQVKPGMHVAELMAGGGYTSELLARAVAPNGVVYAQNTPWAIAHFAGKPLEARLARPVMKDVVRLDRPLEDPFPADVKNLDLVVSNAIYHDTVWTKVDRTKMNRAVFAALAHKGRYAICDSSAADPASLADTQTLHRIGEKVVRDEVTAAGFTLASESAILRNPLDSRDWNASPGAAGAKRGTSDRFCFMFVKP